LIINMTRRIARGSPASLPDATPRVRHDFALALALSGNPREAETVPRADHSPDEVAAAPAGHQALDVAHR
jgi:Flp pilus assembly protein TadD